jgi:hypothetical protein
MTTYLRCQVLNARRLTEQTAEEIKELHCELKLTKILTG